MQKLDVKKFLGCDSNDFYFDLVVWYVCLIESERERGCPLVVEVVADVVKVGHDVIVVMRLKLDD